MSPDLVKVVFRLFHLPDYVLKTLKDKNGGRNAVHVALLGSITELGDWKLGNQLIAKPSRSDPDVWWVTALLPVCTTFEVSWLVVDGNKILFWDPAGDHGVQLSHHDAVVQVSWNRDPTYFFSRTCTLILQTHYYCSEGEALAVVGSALCLGSWDPQHCVLADEYPRVSGHWQVQAQIAKNSEYEWKWAVVDVRTREVKRWEEGANRYISTNCQRLVIRASWNLTSSILYHSPKIYEQTIDMDKEAKFYDAFENCRSLVAREMEHVPSARNKRRKTGEKPFAITESEKASTMEHKAQLDQKLRSRRSLVRKFVRFFCPLVTLLCDSL